MQVFQTDKFLKIKSTLTNNFVTVNEASDQYLVLEFDNKNDLWRITQEVLDKIHKMPSCNRPSPAIREKLSSLKEVGNKDELCDALNDLFEHIDNQMLSIKKALTQLLVTYLLKLWAYKIIVFPYKDFRLWASPIISFNTLSFESPVKEFIFALNDSMSANTSEIAQHKRFMLDQLISRSAVYDVGDLTPATFYLVRERSRQGHLHSTALKGMLVLLREKYKEPNSWTISSFGVFQEAHNKRIKDENFEWALAQDASIEEWVKYAKAHLESNPANFKVRRTVVSKFIQYLIDNKNLSRSPKEFFNINKTPDPLFTVEGKSYRKTMPIVYSWMNEILFACCSSSDDLGRPVLIPGYANPFILKEYRGANSVETHRSAMPTRFIQMALHILKANNFEWAKSLSTKDYFMWRNPESGEMERVWSPVRVYLLMLKLILPARTHQLRFLDSGEGDTFLYKMEGKDLWSKNNRHLFEQNSIKRKTIEKGVFRRYVRKDGSEGAVFYFNTNKTADIDSQTQGYVMPWEKQDALDILVDLRNWQAKYNPVLAPTKWTDLVELHTSKHIQDLEKMGSNVFLFRDPTGVSTPDQPVTDVRVRNLWLSLMDEMEKRLAATGETHANGQPIKLIATRDQKGAPATAVFDLHSLRVSLITAMYEQGVPPEYLMKIVGHASVLMTLYYTKLGVESISDKLNSAMLERQKEDQEAFVGFVSKASRIELEKSLAFRHSSALDALQSVSGAGLLIMDHGMCVGAARRCHEGLPVLSHEAKNEKYSAVPGGASNCTRCRFFVTGPSFLFGLEAHVNNLVYRLRIVSERFEKMQSKLDRLLDEQADCLDDHQPFLKLSELKAVEIGYEAAMAETDEVALSLQAAYNLIEKSIQIVNSKETNESEYALLAAGGLGEVSAVLAEQTEFNQLSRICQNAVWFESLNIDWKRPNLERARIFDKLLKNSGLSPQFSFLDDDLCLKAGNELSSLLKARLGPRDLDGLMTGKATLKSIGIFEQVTKLIKAEIPGSLTNYPVIPILEHNDE